MADDKRSADATEKAARAIYEDVHGKGSWTDASTTERSGSRHQVRLVLAAFAAQGIDLATAATKAAPAPRPAPSTAFPRSRGPAR